MICAQQICADDSSQYSVPEAQKPNVPEFTMVPV